MKTFFVILQTLTLSILLGSIQAKAKAEKSRLSTDIRFDGATVEGKHHKPFGVATTVEEEKTTPTLIDYRRNFNDRINRSKTGR